MVVEYRRFRNTDPPRLLDVWNDALRGRGAVALHTSTPLERHIFAKPYFDPEGLFLAEEDGRVVGFAQGGFGPNATETALDPVHGIVCLIAVRPAHRRRGIGSELLRRTEEYLRQRGSRLFHASQTPALAPFYLGLYGGSSLPGVLASDDTVEPFLLHHGYEPTQVIDVLQRRLNQPIRAVDARFPALRLRYELTDEALVQPGSWWRECVYGLVEPIAFALRDRCSGAMPAHVLVWEMEGFSCRWERPAVGILDLQVDLAQRRQGLGKFLMVQLLKNLQDQCFDTVELHVAEVNVPAMKMCCGLGFTRVDLGRSYERPA